MKYYSQAGEDKYIYEELVSKVAPISTHYLEIGALDGVKYSNTKFFEEHLGWSGILVEPNPVSFEKLKANRPLNTLIPSLISDQEEELEFSYFENENLAAVSGATVSLTDKNKAVFFESDEEWMKKSKEEFFRTCIVKPISFDTVMAQSKVASLGFCSIDVEGHELQVLQSFSFETDISILLIERNPHDAEIEALLGSKGYINFDTVAHNTVYLSSSYHQLIQEMKMSNVA